MRIFPGMSLPLLDRAVFRAERGGWLRIFHIADALQDSCSNEDNNNRWRRFYWLQCSE